MYSFQTNDFVANVCKIAKVYKDNGDVEATIYHKPNGGETFSFTSIARLRKAAINAKRELPSHLVKRDLM